MRPDHNRLRELAQSMHESPVTREVVEGLVDLNDRLLDENDRLREALRTTGRMLFAEWYNGNLDEAAYDRIIEGQPLLVEVDTDAAGSRSGSTTGHAGPKPARDVGVIERALATTPPAQPLPTVEELAEALAEVFHTFKWCKDDGRGHNMAHGEEPEDFERRNDFARAILSRLSARDGE